MKLKKVVLLLSILLISLQAFTQDLSAIKNIDVSSLSDEQIASYWDAIQEKGFTLSQLDEIAKVQGIPLSKVAEFKARVNSLSTKEKKQETIIKKNTESNFKKDPFGINDGQIIKKDNTQSLLFGYDFFNNPNISFTPNINVAVPDTYQIGPGDEITIDLWGASEVTFTKRVDRNGKIKLPGIGFIYVNGLPLNKARSKIIVNLKKKYAGIGAPKGSFSKIFTSINVSRIRTVQVSIIGEIKTPGTYVINSLASMLNAVYAAGGPSKTGSFRNIELIRNNKTVGNLDVYEYLLEGKTKSKIKLQDQDILLVKPYQNLIRVEGAVKRPGIYELNEGESLSNLIRYFGGFTPNSYTNLFVIERLVNGQQKIVKEITLEEASLFTMLGGDKLIVQEALDIFKNRITVNGEVFRPGNFELVPNMTLKDAIEKADGVTENVFLQRGLLIRTVDDSTKENIAFNVADVIRGNNNIVLQKDDEITLFNKKQLKEERFITIAGAVNEPKQIDFVNKLQIEDAILLAGGLKEGAEESNIYVSRRASDGSYSNLSNIFTLKSSTNLSIDSEKPFYLQPFDKVIVRYEKGFSTQKEVSISGEVAFPGSYSIATKDDRISNLIQQAGGLTEFAFVNGATLIRNGFLVAIDLKKILKDPKGQEDLLLKPGDRLEIPEKSETVQVVGEIFLPSLVKYKSGKSLKYYISNSGGFTDKAKKNSVAVQYVNGEIKTVKNFLFFKIYPKVAPGAKILVQKKPETKKLSTQEVIGITSALATLGILIQTLVN